VTAPQVSGPRILGAAGPCSGPTLICVAGLHGNEPAGVLALRSMFSGQVLEGVELKGRLLAFAGNLGALETGQRYGDEDLNRTWSESRMTALREGQSAATAEEREMLELDRELLRALDPPRGDSYLLDLHTTSGPGPSFVVVEDDLANRAFALHFPVPVVLGLEEEVEGTLSQYLSRRGVVAIALESGQHEDPASVDRAEAAVWIAMEASGLIDRDLRQTRAARTLFAAEGAQLPRIVEVRYRHDLGAADQFQMNPGFVSFQPVEAGQLLAESNGRPVEAPRDGHILMPLYQRQGNDGFFIVRSVNRIWLAISRLLRASRGDRLVHLLPGVTRDRDDPDRYQVDRQIARWWSLEIFHLLGFRRQGRIGRSLTMVRR